MGSLLAALVPAVLAAEPSTAALLARRVSVSAGDAAALTTQASTLLSSAGVPGVLGAAETGRRLAKLGLKDATTCGAKPACLAEFGRQLKVEWLVLLSVSRVADDKSLALELFDVAAKAVVEKESLLLPKGTALAKDVLEGFAGRVRTRLGLPPLTKATVTPEVANTEPPKSDTPVNTALTPRPPEPDLPPPPPPPEAPPSHTASWVLGGTAVAALGTAAALLAVGLSTQGQVNAGTVGVDGRVRSALTGGEAQAKAGAATTQLGLAGAAAAVGVGLGTAAVVVW